MYHTLRKMAKGIEEPRGMGDHQKEQEQACKGLLLLLGLTVVQTA